MYLMIWIHAPNSSCAVSGTRSQQVFPWIPCANENFWFMTFQHGCFVIWNFNAFINVHRITATTGTFANQNQIDRYGPPEIRKQTISVWSNWADAECSVTCGGGSKTQTRTCINGNVGDVGCEGSENQELSCNDQDCPGKKLNRTLSFTSRAQKSENRKKS